jgi:hypothetical protein
MPDQAIHDFPARVQHAVADAERLAADLRLDGSAIDDIVETSQYQELVRLKVILQVETSRTLSEAARVAAELEESVLAGKLANMDAGQDGG